MKPTAHPPTRSNWVKAQPGLAPLSPPQGFAAKSKGLTEEASDKWYLVQFRNSKLDSLLAQLRAYGFEVYRPMGQRKKRVGKVMAMAAEPVFPGYLFARRARSGFVPVTSLHGVEWVFMRAVVQSVIDGFKSREVDGYLHFLKETDPDKHKIKAGDTISTLDGLIEAVVHEVNDAGRIVILMAFMGKECPLTVDLARVVKIADAPVAAPEVAPVAKSA